MGKVLVFIATGFEEIEALTVVDILRRGDVVCDTCSINDELNVLGTHNIQITADKKLKEIKLDDYEAIVLPGGIPGATNLRDNSKVINIIKKFNNENKIIAAICAAPIVLSKAGIVMNREITAYPGFEKELKDAKYIQEQKVVIDNNLITSRGPATAPYFAFAILEKLKGTEIKEVIKEGTLFNFLEHNIK